MTMALSFSLTRTRTPSEHIAIQSQSAYHSVGKHDAVFCYTCIATAFFGVADQYRLITNLGGMITLHDIKLGESISDMTGMNKVARKSVSRAKLRTGQGLFQGQAQFHNLM